MSTTTGQAAPAGVAAPRAGAFAEHVPCGHCGRALGRNPRADGRQDETSEVYSRTLVKAAWDDPGEFLPSCSPRCCGVLRMLVGRV